MFEPNYLKNGESNNHENSIFFFNSFGQLNHRIVEIIDI